VKRLFVKSDNLYTKILLGSFFLVSNAFSLEAGQLEVQKGDCPALGIVFEQQCLGQPSDTRYSDYSKFISENMQMIRETYPKELSFDCTPISKEVERSCLIAQRSDGPSIWAIGQLKAEAAKTNSGKETYVPPVYLWGTPRKRKKQ